MYYENCDLKLAKNWNRNNLFLIMLSFSSHGMIEWDHGKIVYAAVVYEI